MNHQFLKEARLARLAKVPPSYSRRVRWLPQIGDVVPDFHVETTAGPLRFHSWAEGRWVYLFSHPSVFTPVCTTEVASLAAAAPDFRERGVSVLGVSNSGLDAIGRWCAEIERMYPFRIDFPVAEDPEGLLSDLLGAWHEQHMKDCPVRKSLVVGPDLKIRMIFEYPAFVGRSTEELLRVIDALQTVETFNVGTPADWEKGDDCLLLYACGTPGEGRPAGHRRAPAPYLQTTSDPWLAPAASPPPR